MIYKFLFSTFFFSLALSCGLHAQLKKGAFKSNSVGVELGKAGLIANINYDHYFNKSKIGSRVFVGSNLATYQPATQVGAGVYKLVGSLNNNFELGIDVGYFQYTEVSDDQISFVLLLTDKYTKSGAVNINIGYRYMGKNNVFRVGVSPMILNTGFLLGGYLSYGIRF